MLSKQSDAAKNQNDIRVLEADIKVLYAQYQHIDENARQLAERFSKVNLDDASEYYQRAFRYFQNGKIDSALIVLEEANFEKQVEDILAEEVRLQALNNTIHHNDSVILQRRDSLIQAIFIKIEAHLQLNQYQYGINAAELTLKLNPDTTDLVRTYNYLSWLYLLKQEFVQAHFYNQKGLVLNPQNEALQRYQAYIAFSQDKIQDNKKAFSTIVHWVKSRAGFRNQVVTDLDNLVKAGFSVDTIKALRGQLSL